MLYILKNQRITGHYHTINCEHGILWSYGALPGVHNLSACALAIALKSHAVEEKKKKKSAQGQEAHMT